VCIEWNIMLSMAVVCVCVCVASVWMTCDGNLEFLVSRSLFT
jgi:hypothetical protein